MSRVRDAPFKWFAFGAAALILAVSGLFGGLDRVEAKSDIVTLEVNEKFVNQPWNVTVTHARMLGKVDRPSLDDDANRWVIILATIEVVDTESRSDMGDILRLSGVDGLTTEAPKVQYLAKDVDYLLYLNPHMPDRVAFFWEQQASAKPPTEVTIHVYGMTRRDGFFDHVPGWWDKRERAVLTMPVEDLR